MAADSRADARDPGTEAPVKAYLHTNVVVRHLTQDPPAQGKAATAFLAAADDLVLVDLVLAELVYVLESFYRMQRAKVAAMARSVIGFPAISTQDEGVLISAVEVYERDRLDFAEAYLVARAEDSGIRAVASFDRSIDRVQGITRIDPLGPGYSGPESPAPELVSD